MVRKKEFYILFIALIIIGLCGCGRTDRGSNDIITKEYVGYSVRYKINEDDKITDYYNNVYNESSVKYYDDFIQELSGRNKVSDYLSYYDVDDVRFYKLDNSGCYYSLVYIEYEATDDIGDITIKSVPGVIKSTNPIELYELSNDEYKCLKRQIESDSMSEGSQSQITRKEHSDSYYEISDAYPKDQIYFIWRYQNWAEGYVCKGYFIDEHGYMYEFDLSAHDFEEEQKNYEMDSFDDAFLDALYYEVYFKNAPVSQLEKSYFDKILDFLWCINYDSEWIEESVACDAGQFSLYTCIDFKMNKISTTGDWNGYLDDENAISLSQLFDEIKQNCKAID